MTPLTIGSPDGKVVGTAEVREDDGGVTIRRAGPALQRIVTSCNRPGM